MSGGAFTYNRFDLYEKKAKKDYDGDGKIESGTEEYMGSRDKAIKKAMGKQVKEDALDEKKELPDFIKKKMDEKKGKKDDDCECDHKDDKKKKVVKEDVLEYILENNYANNVVSAEVLFEHISDEFLESIEDDIMEIYKGKHGQSEKEYQDGRSQAGKMISGDSQMSGAKYSHGRRVSDGGAGPQPAGGSVKPKAQGRMDKGTRADLMYRKANMNK